MRNIKTVLIAMLLLPVGWLPGTTLATQSAATKTQSVRLQALNDEFLVRGLEQEFWRQVHFIADAGGYPFVEATKDADNVRLTFLHRQGANPPANVLLLANINHVVPAELLFERLGSSGVYFLTVEVPKGVRFLYRILENDPLTGLFAGAKYGTRLHLLGGEPDPLNPNRRVVADAFGPGRDFIVTWVELAGAAPQPYIADHGSPRGTLMTESRPSTTLGYSHQISTYLPPNYDPANEYPLMILFDGGSFFSTGSLQLTLENLIAEGAVPPLVVLGITAGTKNGQNQRNTELTCNPQFMAFLNDELLPWFASKVSISEDPQQRIIAGSSYGGLFATYFAFNHPETVAHVLSLSGSFHWGRKEDEFAYEWLVREFAFADKKPIDIFMEVGVLEGEYSWDDPAFPHQIVSHRHFKTILDMKKYDVAYQEYAGGHDMLSWRGGMAEGLKHIFRSIDGVELTSR